MGSIIKRLNSIFFNYINDKCRKVIFKFRKHQLLNRSFSLITDNCLAGFIYHDLDLEFRSPLINGGMNCSDYIKFLTNIEFYLNQDLEFYTGDDNHIWAKLYDIRYRFTHYKTQDEALKKWNSRKHRINYENLYVIMNEKEGCTLDNLIDFDRLPFKNKIVLTHKPYPQIKSAYYLKGFEDNSHLGIISDFIPKQFLGKRYYDNFDFFSWLNV